MADALGRGVRVAISLAEPIGAEATAVDLERLRRKFPHLELSIGRKRQFHHLVCDEKFAVVSNRSFLGRIGKSRSFSHVVSFVLQRPDLIREFADRVEPLKSVGIVRAEESRRR